MAFIRKLPDMPERLEHLKGGAGHLERYAILSPEEMLGAGTVCARMVLQPGCECSCAVKKLNQDKGSQGYRYTV